MTSDLTLVIPHRRGTQRLLRTLNAIQAWPFVVVDDSDAGLDLDVPKVRLGGGQGFARAANAGLAVVRSPWALLLNDDAVPLGDCIERLHHAGGLCGPVLVGPLGIESAGLRVENWGRVQQQTQCPTQNQAVTALSGACLHMPATARFDPRFRHGCEDIDLCRRLGGATLIASARCWHQGGATLSRRSAAALQHAVSGQLRLVGPGWRQLAVLSLCAAQIAKETPFALQRWQALHRGWSDYTMQEGASQSL